MCDDAEANALEKINADWTIGLKDHTRPCCHINLRFVKLTVSLHFGILLALSVRVWQEINVSFSENLKLKVRRAAHFRCCLCRSLGVEIHHITPQEEDGPDTEDNAAPLCPSCHEIYGANSTKRKFIREARDHWYEICNSPQSIPGSVSSEEIRAEIQNLASKDDLADLRNQLINFLSIRTDKPSLISKDEDFTPIHVDKYVQTFYDNNLDDDGSAFEFFFDSRLWIEHGVDSYDLLDARVSFLQKYGERAASRLCLCECQRGNLDLKAFTEEQFGKVLSALHVQVILITGHEEFRENGFQCALLRDGDFVWRNSPKKTSRKSRAKKG